MRLSWLPNAITLLRVLAAPPLAWLILDGRLAAALLLAAAAGLSDAVDGLLAKRFGWQSRLGGLLDPIADKLMLLAGFLALGIAGSLPGWLVVLVLGRDLVIVAGALAYQVLIGPVPAAPSRLSKFTTVVQIALVLLVLAQGALGFAVPGGVDLALRFVVAAATLASGLHYVLVWSGKARRAWRDKESS